MGIKFRNTKKQSKIIDIFKSENAPISASQIYDKLNLTYKTNLSTVYRCLSKLQKLDIIKKDTYQDATCYYSMNTEEDVHYLVCNKCNDVIKLNSCPLTKVISDIYKTTGFDISSHEIKLSGICSKCRGAMDEVNNS